MLGLSEWLAYCKQKKIKAIAPFIILLSDDTFLGTKAVSWISLVLPGREGICIISEMSFVLLKLLGTIDRRCLCLFKDLIQFSWVTQSCLTLCDPMDYSTLNFPVHHQLPELAWTHVHWLSDTIQPSHPLSSTSPPNFSLSQHQSLFQWVSSSYQVAKVLELQIQNQSFQWIFRTDFL